MRKIGLYIHIPFCSTKCCYCDFASFSAHEKTQKEYVAALKKEIALRGSQLCGMGKKATVDTVFVGGGTPSVLYRGGLFDIISEVKKHFEFCCRELTVEANPESVTAEFVRECKSAGANRISLGLQTASDSLLKNLRRHTFLDFLRAVKIVQGEGITNISADVMLSLPGQTKADVQNTVNRLVLLGLPHISIYALKVEQGTPLFADGYLTDEDQSAEFYATACDILSRDYSRYEVSNFAKNGFECKHNKKYWQMQPYLGVGLAASSCFDEKRTTNTRDFDRYLSGDFVEFCEDARPNFLTEYIMLGLRTAEGINAEILQKHGFDMQKHHAFQKYLKNGVLLQDGSEIRLNPDYYYIMNSVISDLI